jgi:hypothetical protein
MGWEERRFLMMRVGQMNNLEVVDMGCIWGSGGMRWWFLCFWDSVALRGLGMRSIVVDDIKYS